MKLSITLTQKEVDQALQEYANKMVSVNDYVPGSVSILYRQDPRESSTYSATVTMESAVKTSEFHEK